MINNTDTFQNDQNASEGNMSPNEANGTGTTSKFKEYGKKSLAPLVDLLHRYKGDVDPYVSAIGRGLQGAVDALSTPQAATGEASLDQGSVGNEGASSADMAVAGWFQEASDWFNGAKDRLGANNPRDLLDYLEAQARKNPAMMFSTSYIAGLAFGRLGRHFTRIRARGTSGSVSQDTSAQSSFNDSEIDSLH